MTSSRRSEPQRGSVGSHRTRALDNHFSANDTAPTLNLRLILIMWNDTDIPLAYFFSFHTYGTWLHGDDRGSVDRVRNRYGSPRLPVNTRWHDYNRKALKGRPFILGPKERRVVKEAIRETCQFRKWCLLASNLRTNHVHVVVTAHTKAELCSTHLRRTAPGAYVRRIFGRFRIVRGSAKGANADCGMKIV